MNTCTQIVLDYFSQEREFWHDIGLMIYENTDGTNIFSPAEAGLMAFATRLESEIRPRLFPCTGLPCELLKCAISTVDFESIARTLLE